MWVVPAGLGDAAGERRGSCLLPLPGLGKPVPKAVGEKSSRLAGLGPGQAGASWSMSLCPNKPPCEPVSVSAVGAADPAPGGAPGGGCGGRGPLRSSCWAAAALGGSQLAEAGAWAAAWGCEMGPWTPPGGGLGLLQHGLWGRVPDCSLSCSPEQVRGSVMAPLGL